MPREKATEKDVEESAADDAESGPITDPDAELTAPTSDDVGEQTKAEPEEAEPEA